MPPCNLKVGDVFGRLEVLESVGRSKHGKVLWRCACSCGGEAVSTSGDLKSGNTKSCGCLQREKAASFNKRHGMSRTPMYERWCNIKRRVYDEKCPSYKDYGGRGIKVCDRWLESFENFYEDMGDPPSEKYSIDRIDNDGDYCPENCRWATDREQSCNTSRNRILTHRGASKTMTEWCEIYSIRYSTVYDRITRYGWSVEDALTKPARRVNDKTK